MNSQATREPGVTATDRIEAAAWIAKLHGADRGPDLELGFRRWLGESPAHRAAFEMASELWNDLATIPKAEHPIRVRFTRRIRATTLRHQWVRPAFAACALIVVVAAVSIRWFAHPDALETRVGEHRSFTLSDGSEVILNTASRVQVAYDDRQRYLRLERGEALFKVAKDSNRPFVVMVGDRKVVALGTAFLARLSSGVVAITLVDGKVLVAAAEQLPAVKVEPPASTTLLSPGQRLTLVGREQPRVDRPVLEKITAWRYGLVNFDHASLTDAIHEMNRYSATPIVMTTNQGEAAAAIKISGVFRAGDSGEFARSIALAYNLGIHESGASIVLTAGVPPP